MHAKVYVSVRPPIQGVAQALIIDKNVLKKTSQNAMNDQRILLQFQDYDEQHVLDTVWTGNTTVHNGGFCKG